MAPNTKSTTLAVPEFNLVGYKNFVRHNPKSDRFAAKKFHHVEFWCMDATNTARRFSLGLGMQIVAKSDLSTNNMIHASYLLRSADLNIIFTAPYSPSIAGINGDSGQKSAAAIPTFDYGDCRDFVASHGLGVRAIAIEVGDAEAAFNTSVAHGAKPSSSPVYLDDDRTVIAEVQLYGDVVLRYVSFKNESDRQDSCLFLPGFEPMDENSSIPFDFGITRLDHLVVALPQLVPAVTYVKGFTGFHEFAEVTSEDIGTEDSGLNSVILANNNEMILFALTEPVSIKLKSQVQTFLDHNGGTGVHHLALKTRDIFKTLKEMKMRKGIGGFEFLPPPPPTYYKNLKNRIGDALSDEQIKQCEEMGILVDKDDQGTLLQVFTKPVGDR